MCGDEDKEGPVDSLGRADVDRSLAPVDGSSLLRCCEEAHFGLGGSTTFTPLPEACQGLSSCSVDAADMSNNQ